ncbi:unnamed protein product, partial [Mesorhabditis spiculigera]
MSLIVKLVALALVCQIALAIKCDDNNGGKVDCGAGCNFCQSVVSPVGPEFHAGCGCGDQSLLKAQKKFKFSDCTAEGETSNDQNQKRCCTKKDRCDLGISL